MLAKTNVICTLLRRTSFKFLMLLLAPGFLNAAHLEAQEKAPERHAAIEMKADRIATGKTTMSVWRFTQTGQHKRPAPVLLHGADGVQARFAAYRSMAENLARAGYEVLLIRYFDRTSTLDDAGEKQRNTFVRWLSNGAPLEKPHSARQHLQEWTDAVADAVAYARRQSTVDAKPTPPYLVLDLSKVHYFGAGFIGILVSTWDRLRKRKRRLVLCGLTPYCSKLIRTLNLDRLFDIYTTQPIPVKAIRQRPPSGEEAAKSPGIRVEKSEVEWDPHMVRLEYIGDDNVPFRSIIAPRTEAP